MLVVLICSIINSSFNNTYNTTMDTNLIKEMIKKTISNANVEVYDTTGTADHFKVVVISDVFDGMSLINRHKLIYKALDKYVTKEIHALQMITKTKQEYSNE